MQELYIKTELGNFNKELSMPESLSTISPSGPLVQRSTAS